MNIIIDDDTHTDLQQRVISTIEFGSAMKGMSTEQSDHDYLHIIPTSVEWLAAPYNTFHLLQYRGDNADHIYCNVHTFVKALLDGDSTIFHEMLRYNVLHDTPLEFLYSHVDQFDHYKTMRAYLGIARRDLKECTKLYRSEPRKSGKKYRFAGDAYNIVNAAFGANENMRLYPGDTIQDLVKSCNTMSGLINDLRTELNRRLDAGEILRSVDNETLAAIDKHLATLELDHFTTGLSYFRDSFQNGN